MSVQRRPKTGDPAKGRPKWVVRYRDPSGREHSKTFTYDEYKRPEKAAKDFDAEQARNLARGTWIDPARQKTTLRTLTQAWIDAADKPETRTTRQSLLVSLGPWADWPVSEMSAAEILKWRRKLLEGRDWLPAPKKGTRDLRKLSPSTTANTVGQLMTVLKAAYEEGLIPKVPVVKVSKGAPLPRGSSIGRGRAEDCHCREREARTYRIPARPWMRSMILVAAGTGMRVSELCALRAEDIGIGDVRVRRQMGRGGEVVPTKSEKSVRDIPVADWVTTELTGWALDHPNDGGWVWTRDDGRPHDRNSATHALARVVRHYGGRKVTWHDFRHFFASALIHSGVPVPAVQQAMGHASPSTTLEVYSHIWPGSDDLVRTAGSGMIAVRDICGI
ncbi:site-specific integrase [Corynebacterium glyciniphilum]|uniref:tyrosine-type recombinase/integrase n=1 Tax=Corynebacterium glyciniphilum TaxID=1404244 RepID=UPI00264F981B|nr:site-specific integrase [Corynebacterium glyciniphilum]MDN6707325.1 site-specific integrase [Corynebacterium glyciniphilum]